MGEEQLTNKIDNTSRKKWDTAEFAKRAQDRDNKDAQLENETAKQRRNREKKERDPLHMGLILHRSNLKARDFEVDLTSRLGKTQMVGMGASLSEQGGYYCNICDCNLKDSQTYLEHINGKRHQRLMGMSMRVEKASLQQVKDRFAAHKRKAPGKDEPYDFKARVLQIEAAEEAEKYEKIERKKRKKEAELEREAERTDDGLDPDMAALMGFSGFGGSKKT